MCVVDVVIITVCVELKKLKPIGLRLIQEELKRRIEWRICSIRHKTTPNSGGLSFKHSPGTYVLLTKKLSYFQCCFFQKYLILIIHD